MKITIITTAKNIEMANFLLAQAFHSAVENQKWCEAMKIKPKDLIKAESFRKQMLKSF